MTHFDEVPRRIRWSEIEFSHRLALEPTATALAVLDDDMKFGCHGCISESLSSGRGSALDR